MTNRMHSAMQDAKALIEAAMRQTHPAIRESQLLKAIETLDQGMEDRIAMELRQAD